jgi:hypothetical protein
MELNLLAESENRTQRDKRIAPRYDPSVREPRLSAVTVPSAIRLSICRINWVAPAGIAVRGPVEYGLAV